MAAEWICRALRDGALEGEHAPALTIKDSITSPLGFDVFAHVLSQHSTNISAGKSQSRLVRLPLLSSPQLAPTPLPRFYNFLIDIHYLQRSRACRVFPESVVLLRLVEQEGTRYCFVSPVVLYALFRIWENWKMITELCRLLTKLWFCSV